MIAIDGRSIGPGHPPLLVADVGSNHEGSLERALRLIDSAARSGAHVVKFQSFAPETIISKAGFEKMEQSGRLGHQAGWDKSVWDTYAAAATPLEWTEKLAEACKNSGVSYMTTPYDLSFVELLNPYVPAWKIGSGDITWLNLLEAVRDAGKPIFLATGASDEVDVSRALRVLAPDLANVVLMQCNTNYQDGWASASYLNLNVIETWKWLHPRLTFGLSDHTPGFVAPVAAVALGARVIEKHFTDDKRRRGPDHAFALEPDEWRDMERATHRAWKMLGDGIKVVEPNEAESAIVQRRALRWTRDAVKGTRIERDMLRPTRPCPPGGLAPYAAGNIVRHTLQHDVKEDELVRSEDYS